MVAKIPSKKQQDNKSELEDNVFEGREQPLWILVFCLVHLLSLITGAEYAQIGQRNHTISGLGCEILKNNDDYTVPARDEFTLHTQLQAKRLTRKSIK